MAQTFIPESQDKRSRHSKGYYTTGAGAKAAKTKALERKKNLEHRMKVESESRYGKGHNSLGIPYK